MKSSFEQEQSTRILSCYNTDIEKGGKRAAIGEVRTWGGKKYVKVQGGWMKYDHGNKKIDSHRKTASYTGKTEQEFSHDQVIKEHIATMSPEEKKEQVSKMKEKVKHLQQLQKKLDLHNQSSTSVKASLLNNNSLDKNKDIQKLKNKIAEVNYGHQSQEELQKIQEGLKEKIDTLSKDDPIKNAQKIEDLKSEYSSINHAIYRRFEGTSKDVVLSGHKKQYMDEKALFNDSTPWDEDLWDSEIDADKDNKLVDTLNQQKISDWNKNTFGQRTYRTNNEIMFGQQVPDDAKISVSFEDGKTAQRTFKQFKDYVEKIKKENPKPELEAVPSKPMRPLVAKDNPEYKAKWRKYFQEEENIKKIEQRNAELTDKYIKANILPIKEIKILSLN